MIEARFTVGSVNGTTPAHFIEECADIDAVAEKMKYLLGRYGHDGNLKYISIVIEVPQLVALKASRDLVNLAIAREEEARLTHDALTRKVSSFDP